MNHKKPFSLLRILILSLCVVATTCGVIYASDLLTGKPNIKPHSAGIPEPPQTMRAFTIPTGSDGDFPSAPNLSAKAQRDHLDQMVAFAETYGFNTILFEAVSNGDAFYRSKQLPVSTVWMGEQGSFAFFDPLDYLTNAAKDKNIRVFALIDPFSISDQAASPKSPIAKNPAWVMQSGMLDPNEQGVQKLLADIVGELGKNYDIAGVVLHEIDSDPLIKTANYATTLPKLIAALKSELHDKQLGITLAASGALSSDPRATLLTKSLDQQSIDFVITTDSPDPLTQSDTLVEQLSAWETALPEGVSYYPMHPVSDQTALLHAVDNAGYFEQQHGADGIVIESYSTLNTKTPIAAVSLAASFVQQPTTLPDMSFSQQFAITRPTQDLNVSSDWKSYYIMGISQSAQPITYNGEEISASSGGLWGQLVSLEPGANKFTFSQGGKTQSITIHRADPAAVIPITDITKSSPYPTASEVILPGESITLSCVAPAGGTVTASLGSLSVTLTPTTTNAKNGTAVTYQAKLDISSLAVAGRVTGLGMVNYQLNYNGLNSSRKSAGTVYLAGKDATPIAKMNVFATMINQNPENDGIYRSILRKDCVDVITGSVGNYYALSMGGYVLKSLVDIPEGDVSATATVSTIALQKTAKGEQLVISSDRHPAYVGTLDENTLIVTLYNTAGWDKMNPRALKGELFDSLSAEINPDNGTVTLTFELSENANLIGWDVSFEGDDMHIYLRKRPAMSENPTRPLENVTVALDPGHGGDDPGALGIPGEQGAAERTLNLANSYSIKARLEALGAQVHMVHENATVSLNERLEFAQKFDADIFISSHHNSVAETADGGKATGIEVYYWNDASADFAKQIGANLATQSEREMRGAEQSFYRVTMMTACPAVLVESGFICNPTEYENLATPYAMFRYGNAVADAVLQYFSPSLLPDTQ